MSMRKFLYVVCVKHNNSNILLEIPFFVDDLLDLHNESTFKELFDLFKRRFSDSEILNVSVSYIGRVKLSSKQDIVFFDLKKE